MHKNKTRRHQNRISSAMEIHQMTIRLPHLKSMRYLSARFPVVRRGPPSIVTKKMVKGLPKISSAGAESTSNYNKKWLNLLPSLRLCHPPPLKWKRQNSRAQLRLRASKSHLGRALARQAWAMAAILRVLIWFKLDSMWSMANSSIPDSPNGQSNLLTQAKRWAKSRKPR